MKQNAKHPVQSSSFNTQEKGKAELSRTRPTSPTWQEKSSANLKRSKKHKRKSLSDKRKTRNQNREKEPEQGSDPYGTPISIQLHQRQKRRRQNRNNGIFTKIEKKMLKSKYIDKDLALFGSVNNLIKATNLPRQKVKHFLPTEPAYTKNRTVIRKTPQLKLIIYDIDEIWSLDLAYVAKCIHDIK